MGDGASPRFGECTDNRKQNTFYQKCKAQVSVFSKDTMTSSFGRPSLMPWSPFDRRPLLTHRRAASESPSVLAVPAPSCPAPPHGLSLPFLREQTAFESDGSFPFPLHGAGSCIKTERGRLRPATRPGWQENPGTPRCCRWRGRSWVRSQPGPSWAGAPPVRLVL